MSAASSTGQQLEEFGLATLGAVAGVVVAVSVIAEIWPQIWEQPNVLYSWNMALFIMNFTMFDGLGAAAGVLAAGKIWDIDKSISGSVLGGLVGGLAGASVGPLLSMTEVPGGWAEFLGMTLTPILPAIGAMLGSRQ